MEQQVKSTYLIKLGSFEREYTLIETNAPRRYDYDYCIPVNGPDDPPKDGSRLVLIESSHVDYQCTRYRSGLHRADLADLREFEGSMTDLFLGRLSERDKS